MEVGGCSTGKSFRFVRASVRAVWLPSGIGSQKRPGSPFPFSLLVPGGLGAFPFWSRVVLGSFPFSPSPTPQTSYPTVVGLIGYVLGFWNVSFHFNSLLSCHSWCPRLVIR